MRPLNSDAASPELAGARAARATVFAARADARLRLRPISPTAALLCFVRLLCGIRCCGRAPTSPSPASYPKGSFVVRTDQAFGRVLDSFEPQ
jgi:hypothetical protein